MKLNDLISAEQLDKAMHPITDLNDEECKERFDRIAKTYLPVFANCVRNCGGILPPRLIELEVKIMLAALVCIDQALG